MLPDFPELKQHLMRSVVNARMRRRVYRSGGVISEARRFQSHEGDKFSIHRLDGPVETSRYRLTEVKFEVNTADLAKMLPQELLARVDQAAFEMAEKISKQTFEKLRQVTKEAGTVTNAGGRRLSADLFFEALEKIELDFYEDDETPHELTMVVGPQLHQALAKLIPEWRQDPALDERYRELISRKREAWRVRESRRKLAD